ncbi:MAG: NAD(P)/FAD-dependent oxidoreductase [Campylobacterales bacterium]|nr:NAD(P)/FAD-dependent oxidoreductase [Campylobacterales bacterium]
MKRRDFLTLGAVGVVASVTGCAHKNEKALHVSLSSNCSLQPIKPKKGKRVVVVGGGFGGLNIASTIKANDPANAIEVIVIERNQNYFSCPMSNTLLSGDPYFKREMFLFDYTAAQLTYHYEVLHGEVVDIDRAKKRVFTSKGCLEYDLLVLAPGIEYDYQVEFPHWDEAKIRQAKLLAPGGLASDVGVEHSILLKHLQTFKEGGGVGNIVIIPPRTRIMKSLEQSVAHASLNRCAPAAYERACMIANWIKKEGLVGKAKVTVLDSSPRPQAKPEAFEQTFEALYKDIIEYVGGFDLLDVDFDTKKIAYRTIDDNMDYIREEMHYDVLNLIPIQRASGLIAHAGLQTNSWGGAILAPRKFYSITDDTVYVIGDSADYGKGSFKDNPKKKAGVPAAAQTAYSSAKVAGVMIARRLLEGKDEVVETFSASCFSMVQSSIKRLGVAIYKDFYFNESGMIIDEEVPKVRGKFYSELAGDGLIGWYEGITADTFAHF